MLDQGVVGDVALNFGAAALDQGAVFFERLDQLQDAAHVVGAGFAQAFELFIDHHGADAVVHVHLQQQRPIDGKGQDVAALYPALAGAHAVLQIKAGVAGLQGRAASGQNLLGLRQRQFGVDRVVGAGRFVGLHADARHLGDEQQLVGLQGNGHAGGHFLHVQVEGLAGGRETKGRQQHHRPHVEGAHQPGHIDPPHLAGVLEVDAIDHPHRLRGDEVAREHAHRGPGHGGVGQALAEGGLDLVAQLPGGLLGAVQRHFVGDAHPQVGARWVPLGAQLLVDLRPETMHQHDAHAHALNEGQILRQIGQLARRYGLACNADHKGLVAKLVDIGCHRAKPGHEGEIKDRGHGRLRLGRLGL